MSVMLARKAICLRVVPAGETLPDIILQAEAQAILLDIIRLDRDICLREMKGSVTEEKIFAIAGKTAGIEEKMSMTGGKMYAIDERMFGMPAITLRKAALLGVETKERMFVTVERMSVIAEKTRSIGTRTGAIVAKIKLIAARMFGTAGIIRKIRASEIMALGRGRVESVAREKRSRKVEGRQESQEPRRPQAGWNAQAAVTIRASSRSIIFF